jgi:hypothetical protein
MFLLNRHKIKIVSLAVILHEIWCCAKFQHQMVHILRISYCVTRPEPAQCYGKHTHVMLCTKITKIIILYVPWKVLLVKCQVNIYSYARL